MPTRLGEHPLTGPFLCPLPENPCDTTSQESSHVPRHHHPSQPPLRARNPQPHRGSSPLQKHHHLRPRRSQRRSRKSRPPHAAHATPHLRQPQRRHTHHARRAPLRHRSPPQSPRLAGPRRQSLAQLQRTRIPPSPLLHPTPTPRPHHRPQLPPPTSPSPQP